MSATQVTPTTSAVVEGVVTRTVLVPALPPGGASTPPTVGQLWPRGK